MVMSNQPNRQTAPRGAFHAITKRTRAKAKSRTCTRSRTLVRCPSTTELTPKENRRAPRTRRSDYEAGDRIEHADRKNRRHAVTDCGKTLPNSAGANSLAAKKCSIRIRVCLHAYRKSEMGPAFSRCVSALLHSKRDLFTGTSLFEIESINRFRGKRKFEVYTLAHCRPKSHCRPA